MRAGGAGMTARNALSQPCHQALSHLSHDDAASGATIRSGCYPFMPVPSGRTSGGQGATHVGANAPLRRRCASLHLESAGSTERETRPVGRNGEAC